MMGHLGDYVFTGPIDPINSVVALSEGGSQSHLTVLQ